jgi:hypothetical protein
MINRVGNPEPRTITRRKRLAQDIRNSLDTYRRCASDWPVNDRVLQRLVRDLDELLRLEGVQR